VALSRVKTWVAGDTLTASDLNAEYNNILNNPDALVTPVTFNLTFTDATYDIGASGATRPRHLYLSGNATIGGGQIVFPAAQSASTDVNTLDDYEEGTWTPVLTFATPGNLNVVYSVQVGRYIKIGRMVTLVGQVTTSTFTHTTASGDCNITGAPFAAVNVTDINATGPLTWGGITKASYTNAVIRIVANTSVLSVAMSGSGQGVSIVGTGDMPTGGTVGLGFTLTYFAAN